ncbi:MAG: biopolymer transport protein ExbD [Cycloclasticus pugetii]|jgi:biopolymer transport protein ExbD|uniref:Biopolymer transporter protein ExbD n=2 Tax=Cycloclasticus TaxID=34067 RepID=S5T8V2_9GAMM|nr:MULTISPECIES: biopolymer transporter ExbD [Cycloclasticus]AFT66882.1 GTP cyclohydrolase I [Cycloclasticus sp. P1]AGS40054.1 Biopolymer transporter protein ExbD [Cycloclasticus zancles 78-ME]ATI03482.1 biopolymer transporter ExbD [Cycloclasticus sp. PY97N]EPD13965.1 GTP cyclohydrolase I [Cycloclasticus pugetii]MBV1899948.1 biopolymer transporter ExbD [Cycloclasticus sp.]|tara:strand:+ start:116 stop:535 length:420 start_codon:yes stop_codon:yes gene_type:complete
MNFKRKNREGFDLNLTPLIDVVFLLLIFFMVTTTFDRETQLKIELPQASGEQKQATKTLEVSIDSKSRFFINDKELVNSGLETIKKALKQAAGDQKNPPLLISADGQATHQSVITVLDAAGQLGFVNITFAANQPVPKQ